MDLISQIEDKLNKQSHSFIELLALCQSVSASGVNVDHSAHYHNEQIKQRAEELLKEVIENDILIHSLPSTYSRKAEQLHQIEANDREIQAAYTEMKETQKQAELWQKRAQHVLEDVTTQHLE